MSGRTPLHWAAESGSAEVAALLLGNRADPNAEGPAYETPLHAAVEYNNIKVLSALLYHDADVSRANDKEATALHYAAKTCLLECSQSLIDQGFGLHRAVLPLMASA